jgi:hypothetical protein
MFGDEAGFGRINDTSSCWAPSGVRPIVPCQLVREYVYAYGAVDPITGDNCFIIAPTCDTLCMNVFLSELSKQLGQDYALLCLDNAGWHKAKGLIIPENIRLFYLPARTPEMNPIEQLWPEVRKDGFKNKLYKTLDHVVERLTLSLNSISNTLVMSVSGRNWIVQMF